MTGARVSQLFLFLLLVIIGAQSALAQPPDQDFESVSSGEKTTPGSSSSYTLDGVTYSATYVLTDRQFVHPSDTGVFLTPQYLSIAANIGNATEIRIADASGDEFKLNSAQISFGNCGATGSCNGLYILVPYRDGAVIPNAGQFIDWDGQGPAVTFDTSALLTWRNIDEIRITRPGGAVFFMAIDNLMFAPAEIQVGGSVTGLAPSESVVLQNNGADNLSVLADGSFTFATPVAPGASYAVTVLTNPASETCSVANGSGTITNTDITNVAVTCANNIYSIGGTINNLATGQTIALQLNGAEILLLSETFDIIGGTGPFTFSTQAISGDAYSVSVLAEPMGQSCSVTNGNGNISAANVSNVQVNCIDSNYTIGGQVSGLEPGDMVVLQNNAGDNLTVSANGAFAFSTPVPFQDAYSVSVLTQPSAPSETCVVTNGSGSVPAGNVTSVNITCTLDTFTVGGAVTGLAPGGGSVELQNNGADTVSVASDGSFTFNNPIGDGSNYDISVSHQPNGQNCIVTNGSGVLAGANVSNIAVSCSDVPYTVGGLLSGLANNDSVVLQLISNAIPATSITLSADGAFIFPPTLTLGDTYIVGVATQPSLPSESCTVTNGSGTMPAGDVNNVSVTCVLDTFPISGSVAGLASGNSVTLQLNGAHNQTVTGNGAFAFTPLADGSAYAVTLANQPSGQTCTVNSGTGMLAGAPVTNVSVSCVDNQYTIGGLLSGLVTGDSVVLQNNAGDNLSLTADGAFVFSTPVDFGDPYAVTVLTQPPMPSEECTVSSGSGTTPAANVNNVTVVCALNVFSVGGRVSGLAAGGTLVLQNNGADDRTISATGNFVFAPQADGTAYAVTVANQPAGQTCSVSDGNGTLAGADVSSVAIDCVDDSSPPPAGGNPATPVPVMPLWLLGLMLALIAVVGSHNIRPRL